MMRYRNKTPVFLSVFIFNQRFKLNLPKSRQKQWYQSSQSNPSSVANRTKYGLGIPRSNCAYVKSFNDFIDYREN